MEEWVTVELLQYYSFANDFIFVVKINGEERVRETNNDARQYSDLKVYQSSPFNYTPNKVGELQTCLILFILSYSILKFYVANVICF